MQQPDKDHHFIKITKPGPQFLLFLQRQIVELKKPELTKTVKEAQIGEKAIADGVSSSWGLVGWEIGLTSLTEKFFEFKYFDEWLNGYWLKVNLKKRYLYPPMKYQKYPRELVWHFGVEQVRFEEDEEAEEV